MAVQTPAHIDVGDAISVRKQLEQHLQEREEILRQLEPRALPSVDPIAYQTVASTRLVVKQISAALQRLDAGTYGQCVRCGSQIPAARLGVVPHASACVACHGRGEAA